MKKSILVVLLAIAGFATTVCNAQDGKEKKLIKKLAKQSCGCIDKINSTLGSEEVLEKINSCITVEILKQQMMDNLGGDELKDIKKLLKDAKLSVKGSDTTIVIKSDVQKIIIADKNFREIQDYMMKNCERMKILVASNDMLSDKSLSKNPEALKYYHEGEDYAKREKFDKAIESYKKALKIDGQFAFAWDNMGICYRYAGNYDEAIKCYKKSLEVDPYGIMPLQNLAVAYEYKKDYKLASETYMKLVDANPDDPEGYFGAGRTFYVAGDYEKGCDYMFKAYKIYSEIRSPYLKDAESVLGSFYADLKEKGKVQIFNDAAKKNNIELN